MKPRSNCYNCSDRKLGCHSTCEVYKQWKENQHKGKPKQNYDAKNLEFDTIYKIKERRRWT